MNKHSFRMIFNAKRGMLMAVSEAATSNGKSAKGEGSSEGSAISAALGAVLLAALPMFVPLTGIAQIIADPNAPRNQQAVILPAGNGVPIVNIQTPTAGGVSMNQFSQFNVNNNGAILNNGRLNTQTQLAGWIQANPHLATGAASVIVNQVNSNNPTLLNGFIEVAGQRAQVIIANPSGIQVNGSGFINAQSATLTTGTPNFNGNVITGYTVNQGTVQVSGAGLDASTTDYTAILARAVQVNAGIWAKNLDVVAGANQINVSSVAATPTSIGAATPTGATPYFAIDVSSLGGMYAGKIMLIGTEAGLGFKNTGTIMGTNASQYAGAGEVTISVDGILSNSGRIQSDAGMTTTLGTTLIGGAATGGLQNTGTIYASGNNAMTTNRNISNTATIAAQGNLSITANGANSNIQSSSTSILAAGMSTAGVLSSPNPSSGHLQVSATQSLSANGQTLAAQNQTLAAQTINLSGSTTYAGNNLNATASTGSLVADNANIVAANTMALSTPTMLSTKGSNVSATQINLKANDWDNTAGNVTHTGTGDLVVTLVGNLTNSQGKIQANAAHTNLTTANLNNTDGLIAGQAVNIVTSPTNAQTLTNTNGTIYAKQDLTVSSGAIGNDKGLIQAAGNVSIDTHHAAFLNTHSGASAGLVSGGNLTVQSGLLDNSAGFIASTGNLSITATDSAGAGALINNTGGIINAAQNTSVFAGTINNTQGQIQSLQNTVLNVTGGQITNNLGLIRTAKNLTITTATLDNSNTQGTNQGIEAANIAIKVATLNNTLGAVRASMGTGLAANLNIAASSLVNNNQGLLSSSGRLNITDVGTALQMTSLGGTVVSNGDLSIQAASLNNSNGSIAGQAVTLTTQNTTAQTLTNTNGTIYARADLVATGGGIGNAGGLMQAAGNLSLATHAGNLVNDQGKIQAEGAITLNVAGANLSSVQGLILANQDVLVQAARLDNTNGTVVGTNLIVNTTATTNSLTNNNGTLYARRDLNLVASDASSQQGVIQAVRNLNATVQSLDNTQGQVQASNVSLVAATTLNNNGGAISATGALRITDSGTALAVTSLGGKMVANGDAILTVASLDNTGGNIVAQNLSLTTQALSSATLTNNNGTIYGRGEVNVSSGGLQNDNGLIQAAGNLSIHTHGANLNNTHSGTGAGLIAAQNLNLQTGALDNSAGYMAATGNVSVTAPSVNNTQGQIQSQQNTVLNVTGGQITNNQGLIRTAKNLTITTTSLDNSNSLGTNQGIEGANVAIGVSTLNNTLGAVRASMGTGLAANLNVSASTLVNNNQGLLSSSGRINVTDTGTALAVTSIGGKIVANGDATLTAATLDNTNGALVAQNISLTTQALNTQTLTNTNGTIYGRGDVTVSSGAIGNDKGIVQADGNLAINTHGAALTNTNAGTTGGLVAGNNLTVQSGALNNSAGYLAATGNLSVTAPSLNNTNGQIQSNGNANLAIAGTLTNQQGLIRSASGLVITATTLDNSNSQGPSQGIEAATISITAPTINNNGGSIKANMSAGAAASLSITSNGTLDNTNGVISSSGNLTIADTLATSASNNLAKTLAITNTGGNISAGKLLTVDAATLSGDGKLTSLGDVTLKLVGAHTNGVSGEIVSSGTTNITVSGLLTNRGLIDGVNTSITAGDVTNLGTGRIYGDNIAIATSTLTNTAETVGGTATAATIAARNRLDIGATNVLNSEHGLIFSDGDINIGGSLNANRQATGQAQLVRNASATIDASGNININAATITNANDHFAYSVQLVNTTLGIREDLSATYYRIFNRYTYEPVVTSSDAATITAGGSINLTGTTITNQQSKIIAGGALSATGTTINNTQITDQRRVNDVGTQYSWGVTGGHSECYPCKWKLDYGMVPSTYNVNTYTTLPVSGGVTQTATSPSSSAAQQLDTTFVSSTVANKLDLGSRPSFAAINDLSATGNTLFKAFANSQEAQSTAAADIKSLASDKLASQAPSNNLGIAAISKLAQSTQAATSTAFTKVTNSSFSKGTPAITVPNNSLFRTPSNINATYLVETDPKFANYKKWLSSDYLLTALSYDPILTQKRLGDGFYEQRLIREQVGTLTGQRFLAGYQSEEEEYRALMDNAVTVAKTFNLRPGIALTDEQVAQLTSDIVWLVEKDVLLPNGTTTRALVPQVYAKLRNGDLSTDGKLLGGSLLSGSSVNLNASGNITNGGTILGRKLVSLTADNINNSNAIQGATVALSARADINVIGGSVTAKDGLYVDAGRDLNVITTTNTTSTSTATSSRTATTLDRVAGLYVTSANGTLVANAGNNISLTSAQIQSAGSAQFQTTNGSINLGAVTTGETLKFEFGERTGGGSGGFGVSGFLNANGVNGATPTPPQYNGQQNLASSTQTGTAIRTGGNLTMIAGGGNITGVAANLSAGGTLGLAASGNVVLTEGRTLKSEDLTYVTRGGGLLTQSATTHTSASSSSTAIGGTLAGANGVTVQGGGMVYLSGNNITSTGLGNSTSAGGNVTISGAAVAITSALNSQSSSSSSTTVTTANGLGALAGGVVGAAALKRNEEQGADGATTTLAPATITGQNIQVTSASNITLGAVRFNATGSNSAAGTTTLNATDTINFSSVSTTSYNSTYAKDKNLVWQSQSGSGNYDQTTNYNTFSGNVSMAAKTITVDMSVRDSAAALAAQPGMGYMDQLLNDPALKDKVNWKAVEEAHKNWNYSQEGLSPAGAAILALAVAYATGGMGSELATTASTTTAGVTTSSVAGVTLSTATATGVSYTAVGAALNAGFTALATTAATSLINNGGDLSKVLKDLGSSGNVKGLITSMATAGVLQSLPSLLPEGLVSPSTMSATAANSNFGTLLAKNLINSAATAVVSSAINGKSLEETLKSSVINAFISTAAAQGANQIGQWTLPGADGSAPKINDFAQIFAHAVLGCATGAAKTSSASGGGGCSAGALGAVVGELTAKWVDPDGTGTGPGGGTTQGFAGLMAAVATAMNGGNPAQINIAAAAATNAVENNYLQTQTLKNALNKLSNCTGFACQAIKTNLKNTGFGGDQKSIEQLADKCRVTGCADDIKDIMNAATMLLTPEARALLGDKDAALLYNKQMADLGKALEASAAGAATFEQRQNVVKVGLALAGTALGGAAVVVVGRTVAAACWSVAAPECIALTTELGSAALATASGASVPNFGMQYGQTSSEIAARLRNAAAVGERALVAEIGIIQREVDVVKAAHQSLGNTTQGVQAWTKHSQRGDGVFPPLTGNAYDQQVQIDAWILSVLRNPSTSSQTLSRGGAEYRLPSGQGFVIEANGKFNFLHPSWN